MALALLVCERMAWSLATFFALDSSEKSVWMQREMRRIEAQMEQANG